MEQKSSGRNTAEGVNMNETLTDLLQVQQLANTAVSVYSVDKRTPTELETNLIATIKTNLNNLISYLTV